MVLPSRPDVELLELLVELLRLLDVDVTAEVRLALALPPDVELLELPNSPSPRRRCNCRGEAGSGLASSQVHCDQLVQDCCLLPADRRRGEAGNDWLRQRRSSSALLVGRNTDVGLPSLLLICVSNVQTLLLLICVYNVQTLH